MAKTPEKVYELLDKVWNAALPNAKMEREELQKMMTAEGYNEKLEAWDWWYYSEKLRKQKFDLDDELLKPYFELFSVRHGMFGVAFKLYGLIFKERFDIPKPHEDASTFEVSERGWDPSGRVDHGFFSTCKQGIRSLDEQLPRAIKD